MPLFFLHQCQGSTYIRDDEGAEFVSLSEAKLEAIVAVRELMSETVLKGVLDLTAVFEIEGPDGQRSEVRFSEAIQVTL